MPGRKVPIVGHFPGIEKSVNGGRLPADPDVRGEVAKRLIFVDTGHALFYQSMTGGVS